MPRVIIGSQQGYADGGQGGHFLLIGRPGELMYMKRRKIYLYSMDFRAQ